MKSQLNTTKKDAYSALIIGTFAMMVCFMSWLCLAPLSNEINQIFHLTVVQKTVLLAMPVLLGSIMRIPLGIMSDRFGGKKIYIFLLLFLLIPLFLIPRVHSYELLLVAAFLLGMSGTSFAVGISYVSAWFPPEKQGLILGIAGMGNLGTAISALILPRMAEKWNFEGLFTFLIVLTIITILIVLFGCKEMPVDPTKTLRDSLVVVKEKSTWLLSLFYALTFGLFMSLSNLIPTFMNDLFKTDAVVAGMWTAVFAGLCTFARPVGGLLSDRFRPSQLLQIVFFGISIVAFAMMGALNSYAFFSVILVAVALVAGLGNGIVFKMVPTVSKGNTGAVTGIVGALGGLGGYFPPIILGVIKTYTGSFQIGILLLALFALFCWFVLYLTFIRNKQVA
ncbi:Probable nitrate transporter narT [Listeria grayi]|uniref:Nitrite extrusion protein n=1 Tax=Listeria grayi FSL F6-1183 TaxID=1265827 RepID=A0A829R5K2_LISGR|nr:NarK/NasA family nitrate transporter [Listeria grayi]EUJ27968.1 nitrite extrusion protein [Listeria grayi FSL F6-1183]VEI30797.1 Probable nitrate transporter narT [Listeria grayi]